MPRGRKKNNDPEYLLSKAGRLTFSVDNETAKMFKALAAVTRSNMEELGEKAIQDLIKKYKPLVEKFKISLE